MSSYEEYEKGDKIITPENETEINKIESEIVSMASDVRKEIKQLRTIRIQEFNAPFSSS